VLRAERWRIQKIVLERGRRGGLALDRPHRPAMDPPPVRKQISDIMTSCVTANDRRLPPRSRAALFDFTA